MKKGLFIAFVAFMLLMSGCSQKKPEVDMTQQESSGVIKSSKNEVVDADSGVNNVIGSEESALDITTNQENDKTSQIKELEAKVQNIYFDFDKFNIRPDQEPKIAEDAKLFTSDVAKDLTIKIEGNCDEWGTDEYNYALGLKRAKSVRDALVIKGVDESRMIMISYGESNPVCTEHTRECWAQNRRVEFKLLP